jgi:membrane protease YdiL (CAAX protease family)
VAATGGRRRLAAIGWTVAFLALTWILTALLAFVAAWLITGSLAAVPAWSSTVTGTSLLVQGAALLLAGLCCTWLIGVRAAGLDLDVLRWRNAGPRVRGAMIGVLAGGLAAAAALLIAVALSSSAWTPDSGGGLAYAGSVARTGAVLAPAALAEEVAFRGVPLILLAAAFGRGTGLVLTALLFALGHVLNPSVSMLAFGNVALAGIFLGLAFFAPGGLWTAFGAHFGWNLTLAALDAPVSGLPFRIPWLDYVARGPVWLTGGAFGPEGGLAATGALTAACLVFLRRTRKEMA